MNIDILTSEDVRSLMERLTAVLPKTGTPSRDLEKLRKEIEERVLLNRRLIKNLNNYGRDTKKVMSGHLMGTELLGAVNLLAEAGKRLRSIKKEIGKKS
jgi:hypothetical protein